MKVAIVAISAWDFDSARNEDFDNYLEDAEYVWISRPEDVESGVKFDRSVFTIEAQDEFSWNKMEAIRDALSKN